LAASEGAAETAIAITATAPTNKILAMDFMMKTPSMLKTVKNYTQKGAWKAGWVGADPLMVTAKKDSKVSLPNNATMLRWFDFLTVRFLSYYANSDTAQRRGSPMKSAKRKLVDRTDLRTVKGRKPNDAYRTREHLTESEIAKLLTALKANRHGLRDWLIGLLI
jgi:hypothetical protein